jgi:hypothetical protein
MKFIIFNINGVWKLRFAALVLSMAASFGSALAAPMCPPAGTTFDTNFISNYKNISVSYACNNQSPLYSTKLYVNGQQIGLNTPRGCSSQGTATVADGATIQIYGLRDIGGGNYLQTAGNWGNGYYPPSWVPACTLAWDDGGGGIPEGFMTFTGTLKGPALSLSKTASGSSFTQLASGQYYTLTIAVASGPTTGSISISDSLPTGITTSGAVTINSTNSGKLSGCPAAGAANLTGCTVATGAVTPIVITVPVNVSLSTASSVTNTASVSGGGDAACTGSGVCQSNVSTSVASPPYPTIVINKSLGSSRVNNADQFTVQILNGGNVVNDLTNSTTTGAGSAVAAVSGTTGTYRANAGTAYTLTEAGSGGANLGQYQSTLTCTDSTGIQTGLPSNAAFSASTGYALTPVAGAQISCTITNTPKLPTITLDQTVTAGLALPATYQYTGDNGWAAKDVTSTVAGVPGASTPVQNLTAAGTDTVITPTLPAGLRISNAYCIDTNYAVNGNSGGFLGRFTDNVFTIPAANVRVGSVLVCHTVLVYASPTITLSKALSGNRISNSDQFSVQVRNADGTLALATGTTSGVANTIAGGSTGTYAATSGTVYTLHEVMASGSVSSLGQYGTAVSCSNSGVGGTVVTGVRKLGDDFTAAMGDVISCRITNSVSGATLQVRQLVRSPVPVNIVPPFSYIYPASNNGWTQQTLVNTSMNVLTSSPVVNLTSTNTNTTVYTTLPDNRWYVSSFSCTDTNAAVTGNPTGALVTVNAASVTIPAAKVLAGSKLVCTILLGRHTP